MLAASGPAPFVAVALVGTFHGSWPISLYIILACAVTLGSLMAAPRPVR